MNQQIEPGTMRFVLDATHERIGVVLGPYLMIDEADARETMRMPVATGGELVVSVAIPVAPRETVTWWLPSSRRWSKPEPEWQIAMDTIHLKEYQRRSGPLRTPAVRQIPEIVAKIQRDLGIVIPGGGGETWYGIPDALGISIGA